MAVDKKIEAAARSDGISVKLCEHNRIIFWWPIWFFGYILGLATLIYGDQNLLNDLKSHGANWLTLFNLSYVGLILFVIYFTNIRAERTDSLVFIGAIVILALLLSLFLGVRNLLVHIPSFLVFMNASFYFTFSSGLLLIWLFVVFWVDQRRKWYLRPGVVVESVRFEKDETTTMEGLKLIMTRNDIPCHFILGLGLMGDIEMVIGTPGRQVKISNVANVGRKMRHGQSLIHA